MIIKVLGPGCTKCKEAEQLVRSVVQETGSPANVEKVSDFQEMMALGVMSTPAVVIDGVIMCTGRVPSKAEIMGWIAAPATTCTCGGKC